jgi:hypothetical protein
MERRRIRLRRSASAMMSAGCLTVGLSVAPGAVLAACAPCAPKSRRSAQANPCAAKSPCAAKGAAKSPCSAANPCAAKGLKRPANYAPHRGKPADLIATGKALFSDTKLSTRHVLQYLPQRLQRLPANVCKALSARRRDGQRDGPQTGPRRRDGAALHGATDGREATGLGVEGTCCVDRVRSGHSEGIQTEGGRC